MNSATINLVLITKIHSLHMIHHGYKQTNIKNSLNENNTDYRKKDTNTICYIQPSQQQKRNCLQMRKGPTITNDKVKHL